MYYASHNWTCLHCLSLCPCMCCSSFFLSFLFIFFPAIIDHFAFVCELFGYQSSVCCHCALVMSVCLCRCKQAFTVIINNASATNGFSWNCSLQIKLFSLFRTMSTTQAGMFPSRNWCLEQLKDKLSFSELFLKFFKCLEVFTTECCLGFGWECSVVTNHFMHQVCAST